MPHLRFGQGRWSSIKAKLGLTTFVAWVVVPLLAFAVDSVELTHLPETIMLGDAVNYTATVKSSYPVDTYKWEYRCIEGSCAPSGWAGFMSASNTLNTTERRVGKSELKCTVQFKPAGPPGPGNPPPPVSNSITIAIIEPTSDPIVTGLSTSWPYDAASRLLVEFELRNGERACGASIDGYVQEKLTNKWYILQIDPIPDDTGWAPITPPVTEFQLVANRIRDMKGSNVSQADWNQINIGQVFYTADQQNRLVVKDCCATPKTIEFPKHKIKRRKVSGSTWQLEEG